MNVVIFAAVGWVSAIGLGFVVLTMLSLWIGVSWLWRKFLKRYGKIPGFRGAPETEFWEKKAKDLHGDTIGERVGEVVDDE